MSCNSTRRLQSMTVCKMDSEWMTSDPKSRRMFPHHMPQMLCRRTAISSTPDIRIRFHVSCSCPLFHHSADDAAAVGFQRCLSPSGLHQCLVAIYLFAFWFAGFSSLRFDTSIRRQFPLSPELTCTFVRCATVICVADRLPPNLKMIENTDNWCCWI